jgi:hypothetical protein
MSSPGSTNVPNLIKLVNDQFTAGNIDNPSNMNGQKVYMFHGTRDTTVNPTNGQQVKTVYENFGVSVTSETSIAAVHGYVRETFILPNYYDLIFLNL